MTRHSATCHPRVGLLGNPSDGFGGQVIAFTFTDFAARVEVEDSPTFAIEAPGGTVRRAGSVAELVESLHEDRTDGTEVPRAALTRFLDRVGGGGTGASFVLRFSSNIPRQVGLAGSSAIATATLRALAQRFEVELPPLVLADLALTAETEVLGIAAGPQDRVVQALGGLLHMDFADPTVIAKVTRLAPGVLPPLFLAWTPSPGASSGDAHRDLRTRRAAGDKAVQQALDVFPRLADVGRHALGSGDHDRLCDLLDESFDTRASIWPLTDADHALVRIARGAGAAAKLAGSGGAVVGVPREAATLPTLEAAYHAAGFAFLRPTPEEKQ